MNAITLATRSSTERNSPRLSSRRARIEKNSSSWFSQEAWGGSAGGSGGGNKPPAGGAGEGGGAALPHQVHLEPGRDLGVQVVEEAGEGDGGVAVKVGGR